MIDRQKIIKGLECCQYSSKSHCDGCPYDYNARGYCNECTADLATDVLELLNENRAVKPVRDSETGRFWICGNCGGYVGFEDNDEYDPNEFSNFCADCGKPVLWEGR